MFSYLHKKNKRFCYRLNQASDFLLIQDWAQQFELISYLNSNQYYNKNKSDFFFHKYEFVLGFSQNNTPKAPIVKPEDLKSHLELNSDWLMGYLAYDLKNEWFNIDSKNQDQLAFDDLFFFVPDMVFYKKGTEIFLESLTSIEIDELSLAIRNYSLPFVDFDSPIKTKAKFTRAAYLDTVKQIKQDIQMGNVYELNFCQEFYNEQVKIDPWLSFKKLTRISPTPFSAYLKQNDKFLISASPERYIAKRSNTIISQPIKGTIKKTGHAKEDAHLVETLKHDPKEMAENVMIVDLVRNDLSQTAQKGSVKVDELCGIYPFKQLYQMISTVSSKLRTDKTAFDVIQTSFPMGSMTGAPKVSAMQLIEKYEQSKRGLYSGSAGYFSPDGDFDFSVVIRSILYNQTNQYLSFTVGSAITINAEAEKEYDECLLKAKAILESLN